MKKRTRTILLFLCAAVILVPLFFVGITKFCIHSYGSGQETVLDVLKVNTGTEYILLSETEKQQKFLASDHWNCIHAMETRGYHHTDTMGTGTFYEKDDGERICLVATNQWCKLFREYSFQSINGEDKIQDILKN